MKPLTVINYTGTLTEKARQLVRPHARKIEAFTREWHRLHKLESDLLSDSAAGAQVGELADQVVAAIREGQDARLLFSLASPAPAAAAAVRFVSGCASRARADLEREHAEFFRKITAELTTLADACIADAKAQHTAIEESLGGEPRPWRDERLLALREQLASNSGDFLLSLCQ